MTQSLPFFIIGIITMDEEYHQLLTCSKKDTAEKLAALVKETIRVSGGGGVVDMTEVTE